MEHRHKILANHILYPHNQQRHHRRYGVLERRAGHDLAGPDVGVQQPHHGPARTEGIFVEPVVGGGHRCRPRQRHAYGLAYRSHGIGREHAGTRAGAGTSRPFDLGQLGLTHATFRHGADALEDRRRRLGLPERFLLFVGMIYPGKNVGNMLRAFSRVCHDHDIHLVVAGGTRWKYEDDLALIDELGFAL